MGWILLCTLILSSLRLDNKIRGYDSAKESLYVGAISTVILNVNLTNCFMFNKFRKNT